MKRIATMILPMLLVAFTFVAPSAYSDDKAPAHKCAMTAACECCVSGCTCCEGGECTCTNSDCACCKDKKCDQKKCEKACAKSCEKACEKKDKK
jgi:hypothetical protein